MKNNFKSLNLKSKQKKRWNISLRPNSNIIRMFNLKSIANDSIISVMSYKIRVKSKSIHTRILFYAQWNPICAELLRSNRLSKCDERWFAFVAICNTHILYGYESPAYRIQNYSKGEIIWDRFSVHSSYFAFRISDSDHHNNNS